MLIAERQSSDRVIPKIPQKKREFGGKVNPKLQNWSPRGDGHLTYFVFAVNCVIFEGID